MTTRTRPLTVALAAAVVVAVAAAGACSTENLDTSPQRTPPSSPLSGSTQDRTWLKSAHQANLAEITAGRIAQRKSPTQAVKSIGAMLVQDHRRLDQNLTAVAQRLGVELPNEPTAKQMLKADELKKGVGRTFDRDWISAMIAAHQTAIAETSAEIGKGSAAEVTALAKNTLPVLQQHLARLQVAKG